jgi:Rieske 2Fe-2S family protein
VTPAASVSLRADLVRVALPFAEAHTPPRAVYVDPALHARELALLLRDGLAAGSEADLPQPGAWSRVPLEGLSLALLRGPDGEVRALHDVCRHRGVQLLAGLEGRVAGELECPYHGWCYDPRGPLLRAPGLRDDAERGELGLRAARVWSRWGQLFVADVPPAPPPRLAGPPWLDELHHVPLRRARRVRWEVAAGWKLLVENFQESHHFPRIHPGLEARTPARDSTSVTTGDGWLGGTMRLRDELETVSLSGRRLGRPFIVPPSRRRTVFDAWVAPNLLTSLQPDYLLTYRLTPRAVDRTDITAEIYTHAEAPPDPAALEDIAAFWDRTNAEDRAICERQQRGLADRGYRPHRYAAGEDGMHAFDAWWAARLLAALEEPA